MPEIKNLKSFIMARVLVLGAGISGHTAVMYLKKILGKKHEVIMVSPNSNYQWVSSNQAGHGNLNSSRR